MAEDLIKIEGSRKEKYESLYPQIQSLLAGEDYSPVPQEKGVVPEPPALGVHSPPRVQIREVIV